PQRRGGVCAGPGMSPGTISLMRSRMLVAALVAPALGLAAMAALPGRARADDALRRGVRVVEVGDPAISVEEKCGSPTDKRVEEKWVRTRRGSLVHMKQ